MLVFAGLPLVPLVHVVTLNETLWRVGSGLTAAVVMVLVAGFGAAWEKDSAHTGLFQRGALILGLGWLGALCVHLMP